MSSRHSSRPLLMSRPRPRGRRLIVAATSALVMIVGLGFALSYAPLRARAADYGAPLPATISATYFDTGVAPYVFVNRDTDLARMAETFNTVVVSATPWRYNDTSLVDAVRRAGMAAVIEFDYKSDFANGVDISTKISQIIATTKAHPGLIAGISVADQLNKGTLTVPQQLAYLAATGGRFHAEIPGVPVFTDAASWELTCNQPGQSSCAALSGTSWGLQTNAVLETLKNSGDIDGFFLSDNLKGARADVNDNAYATARQLFPRPFRIVARTSQVSFQESSYPGTAQDAAALVAAYVTGPRSAGVDGSILWSWHRPWVDAAGVNELRTFLNKDATSNTLWDQLAATHVAGNVATAPPPAVAPASPPVPPTSPTVVAPTSPSTVAPASPPRSSAPKAMGGSPGFELGTAGWQPFGQYARLTRSATAHTGHWSVRATNSSTVPSYIGLNDSPNLVLGARPGTYQAIAWVRTDRAGVRVTLRLRAYRSGVKVGEARATVIATTGGWTKVRVTIRILGPGRSLDLNVYGSKVPAGGSVLIDDVSLVKIR